MNKLGHVVTKHVTTPSAASSTRPSPALPRVAKTPTPKQAFVAAIGAAGTHLPLSKNIVNSLAKFAVNADDETTTALMELLAQPDPHGSLAVVLPFRVRNALADYTDIDESDLAHWIKSANICFQAVDELLTGLGKTYESIVRR